jgi:hypothetical protein
MITGRFTNFEDSTRACARVRLEALRRDIDARARAFVLRLVVALVVAFSAGFLLGKLWR